MHSEFKRLMLIVVACVSLVPPAVARQDAPPADDPAQSTQPEIAEPARPVIPEIYDPTRMLLDQLQDLHEQLLQTRQALAQADIDFAQCQRELDELRQFLADNQQFGRDFEQYKSVKAAAEREARQREIEANRQKREADKAQRDAKRRAAMAERSARQADAQKMSHYRQSGFSALGLDVFNGKMAFYYETRESTPSRIDWEPGFGHYQRLYSPIAEVDYSHMTISGSILNAADEIRNVGVAITFFDEVGNQVGHEIVKINNARPDVPYPFTSKIDMALNRPFDSSSIYVLYADSIEDADAEAITPAPLPTKSTPTPATPKTTNNYSNPK